MLPTKTVLAAAIRRIAGAPSRYPVVSGAHTRNAKRTRDTIADSPATRNAVDAIAPRYVNVSAGRPESIASRFRRLSTAIRKIAVSETQPPISRNFAGSGAEDAASGMAGASSVIAPRYRGSRRANPAYCGPRVV